MEYQWFAYVNTDFPFSKLNNQSCLSSLPYNLIREQFLQLTSSLFLVFCLSFSHGKTTTTTTTTKIKKERNKEINKKENLGICQSNQRVLWRIKFDRISF